MYTEQMSQRLSLIDKIDPASVNSANTNSTGIDLRLFKRAMFEVQVGAITGAATVDAKLQSCAAANFASGVHNLTGGAITQVTNANPNSRVTLETTDEAVEQQNPGDRYLRLLIIVGANAAIVGATGWGSDGHFKPENKNDPNTVLQRLVVT